MNRNLIAKELVAVAKELTAIDEPDERHMKRLERDLSSMAGEKVEALWIKGAIIALAKTELGMYRIWDKYGAKKNAKGRSSNLGGWYVNIVDPNRR